MPVFGSEIWSRAHVFQEASQGWESFPHLSTVELYPASISMNQQRVDAVFVCLRLACMCTVAICVWEMWKRRERERESVCVCMLGSAGCLLREYSTGFQCAASNPRCDISTVEAEGDWATSALCLPLKNRNREGVHLALWWRCKETHFMKKMRLLMTYNRCIFLHCFSFRACGLGLGARESAGQKKKRAQEWVKMKWTKCSHA